MSTMTSRPVDRACQHSVSSTESDDSSSSSACVRRERAATTSSTSSVNGLRRSLLSTGSFTEKDKFSFLVSPCDKNAEVIHPIVMRYLSHEPMRNDSAAMFTSKRRRQTFANQKSATVPNQLNYHMQMTSQTVRDRPEPLKSSASVVDAAVRVSFDSNHSDGQSYRSRRNSSLTHSSIEPTV